MTTLSERLQLLADRVGGERELARRAGLTETHINGALRRIKAREAGKAERGDIGLSTAATIARAAQATVGWLATGDGPPFAVALDAYGLPDPDRPALREVLAALAPYLTPELVRKIWALPDTTPPRTPIEWAARIHSAWEDAGRPPPALPDDPKLLHAADEALEAAGDPYEAIASAEQKVEAEAEAKPTPKPRGKKT